MTKNKMIKILVLATNYPSGKNPVALNYIHTRNLYYINAGYSVEVLNFATEKSYVWDKINVISLGDYEIANQTFDILVSHAPNLRNHYFFIKKYGKKFKNIVFFFHGHEVLFRSRVYSKPYKFMKDSISKRIVNDLYDFYKLKMWNRYFRKILKKSYFVFVSKWMLREFEKWVGISRNQLNGRYQISYNGIGKNFENTRYNFNLEKKYDFITIRSVLDGSKYAVDIVCDLAKQNPKYMFLLVGKGRFFDFYDKPENVEWINEYCDHTRIVTLLNMSRCALMLTRTDAQGLMACEIASTGMPLITSDIEVCHEIFNDFENVEYICNENANDGFLDKYNSLQMKEFETNKKFYFQNTVINELEMFEKITEG